MATTGVLAVAAMTLSLASSIICIVFVCVVTEKGSDLRDHMGEGAIEFRLISDTVWTRIITIRNGKMSELRRVRLANCRCFECMSYCQPVRRFKDFTWICLYCR